MRINIIKQEIDSDYLYKVAHDFEEREAMTPYLIMSSHTMSSIDGVCGDSNGYEFCECKILINNDLSFGDVDIR